MRPGLRLLHRRHRLPGADQLTTLSIPRLQAGGLNLGYRCSSRCRHCLYACGPHRRDGLADDLDSLLDELKRRAPLAAFHVGGGEPFLDLDLLSSVLEGFSTRGLLVDYVETNASWVRSEPHARETLTHLRSLGLNGLLVSASHFHAEFVTPRRTLALVAIAREVLPSGVIVWLPDFLSDLASLDPDSRLDLDALIAERGDGFALQVALRYGVIPGGRAGRLLASHGFHMDWPAAAQGAPCRQRLENTTHFHVDLEGNYVPGLCGGIVIPLSLVPGPMPAGRFPVLERLHHQGLSCLVAWAIEEHGFAPLDSGYSGACDLCTHVRIHLHARGTFEELGPSGFYDERSITGY